MVENITYSNFLNKNVYALKAENGEKDISSEEGITLIHDEDLQ